MTDGIDIEDQLGNWWQRRTGPLDPVAIQALMTSGLNEIKRLRLIAVRAQDEEKRLRQGIMNYLSGNYEHPAKHRANRGRCRHGTPWHLPCEQCTDEYFGALIEPQKEAK